MKLSIQGRAHRALRRLAQGSATYEGLQAAAWPVEPTYKARKCRFLCRDLVAALLIELQGNVYRITADGDRALAELDAGREFVTGGQPTVRIFRKAA